MTDSRTVLVTGTSSGIGLATAVTLASAGWTVVATMRDTAKAARLTDAAAAAGVTLDVRQLDITDDASVRRCLDEVVAEHGGLDALVNNAGAGHVGTLEQEDLAQFQAVIDLNLIGTARITRAVLPLLRASRGHVLTVTSVGGVVGQPFNEAYCAAKFAVEGMLESLAPVARQVGVTVTVVEPGAVASDFVANADVDVDRLVAAMGPYGDALGTYLERTAAMFSGAQEPQGVADVIAAVLADPDPAFRHQTSPSSAGFAGIKLTDLDGRAVQATTGAWVG